MAAADGLAPRVRLVQTAPRPMPLNDAASIGSTAHSPSRSGRLSAGAGREGAMRPASAWLKRRRCRCQPRAPSSIVATIRGPADDRSSRNRSVAADGCRSESNTAIRCRRSPAIDAVARQADAQTAHGFELAQRGAIYSARAEFVAALHTIAAALDSASGGNSHERMLTAGLQALDEADDFAAHGASASSDGDVARIVAGHQTPVLKDAPLSGISCTAAMSRYLTFAQEQLAGCTAGIPAGSAALYGLGKIYRVPESMHGPADPTHGAKAVALYQAALLVDSRNYRAANELGVLLAKFGRLPEARAALLHSIAVSPQPTTWQNLSAVHQTLGERDLASEPLKRRCSAAARLNQPTARGPVDPSQCNGSTRPRSPPQRR